MEIRELGGKVQFKGFMKEISRTVTLFPRSLFSHFTEDELKKISESLKSSVNWTEYNKWLKEGQPFEEHEEIELFINHGNGSSQSQVSTGTERSDSGESSLGEFGIGRYQEQENGGNTYHSEGKANSKARKESYFTSPFTRSKAEAVTWNDHEHCRKVPGSNEVYISRVKSGREIRLDPKVDIYDIVPKGSYMYAFVLPKGQYLMLRYLRKNDQILIPSRPGDRRGGIRTGTVKSLRSTREYIKPLNMKMNTFQI
ncbi:hypothetical protein C1645_742046 [Glomus cerebriforme]|uniref:Uncharacterized protein n=1 Tax=Glomus cerebriforme TaxID=658196 RepID=A0A397SF20_9GLOM|nr:hypothetical protein C1645_742046 [Glomus cerebriforme]